MMKNWAAMLALTAQANAFTMAPSVRPMRTTVSSPPSRVVMDGGYDFAQLLAIPVVVLALPVAANAAAAVFQKKAITGEIFGLTPDLKEIKVESKSEDLLPFVPLRTSQIYLHT